MNIYKLCLRVFVLNQLHDFPLWYFQAEDSKKAAEIVTKKLKEEPEMATFFEEDSKEEYDKIEKVWTLFRVRPESDWYEQEHILASFDYSTFELTIGDETTTSYFYNGVYPDNY